MTVAEYEKCVQTLSDNLYRFALKSLRDEDQAKDIVQDTFFKLWTTPHKFSATTDLRFYLYRSVQNQCLNYIRNKKVEDRYRDRVEVVSEDLQQAIDELPEKYRKVINLSLEGLSDKEVALRLGISIDAVKQQKKRGKEQLKEKLNHPFLFLLINFL